jgi:hypothetical protein
MEELYPWSNTFIEKLTVAQILDKFLLSHCIRPVLTEFSPHPHTLFLYTFK